jgi:lysophospholipid acyltransferase (LPLAT)-like uncharacterized protein
MTNGSPTPAKVRRSGVVVPHRPKWHAEIAACAIWLLGRTLSATLRLDIHDEGRVLNADVDHPFIGAIWHNRLAIAMPVWTVWKKRHPNARLAGLISASRDGALLARTFSYFGVKPVRGSTSRRGPQALLELNSALRDGFCVAITPDGPRGPKYQVQSGIISLAQVSGIPIVPVGVHISHKKRLRSWDAFQIPLPFAMCSVTFGPPIQVARDASPEDRELSRLALQNAMISLNAD